jgi:ribonuclease Z
MKKSSKKKQSNPTRWSPEYNKVTIFFGGVMNRLTILGSGFAVANQNQENSYLLFQGSNRVVLIDCGNNPVGKMQRIGVSIIEVTDLVLTHAHADHMGTLPLLLMDMWLMKRTTELNIYGLKYTLDKAKSLLSVFDWEKWANMFKVNFVEVSDEGIQKVIDDQVRIFTGPVLHLIPTVGVRIEIPETGKTLVYSCDGEPCENLDKLAAGATVLLQETAGPGKGHTSAEEAGKNAARAGASELIFIHYPADANESTLVQEAASYFEGKIKIGKDLMYFE